MCVSVFIVLSEYLYERVICIWFDAVLLWWFRSWPPSSFFVFSSSDIVRGYVERAKLCVVRDLCLSESHACTPPSKETRRGKKKQANKVHQLWSRKYGTHFKICLCEKKERKSCCCFCYKSTRVARNNCVIIQYAWDSPSNGSLFLRLWARCRALLRWI